MGSELATGREKWAIFFSKYISNTNPNPKSILNTAPSTMILVAGQFDNDDDDGCRCKDKNDDSSYIRQGR